MGEGRERGSRPWWMRGVVEEVDESGVGSGRR